MKYSKGVRMNIIVNSYDLGIVKLLRVSEKKYVLKSKRTEPVKCQCFEIRGWQLNAP